MLQGHVTGVISSIGRQTRRFHDRAFLAAMREADWARDGGDHSRAASLYQGVLDRWGPRFGVMMQLGNALKDSGAFDRAEQVYRAALRIEPLDADCHLQLGHLMKLSGKLARAEGYYVEANRLDPNLLGAIQELRNSEAQRITAPNQELGVVDAMPAAADSEVGARSVAAKQHYSRDHVLHQRLLGDVAWRRK